MHPTLNVTIGIGEEGHIVIVEIYQSHSSLLNFVKFILKLENYLY